MKPSRKALDKDAEARATVVPSQSGTVRSARPHAPQSVFEGDLAFLPLADLLHHVCVGHRDRVVEISDGESLGHIIVQKGKVVRCSVGNASGISAFCHLVKLRSGHFQVTRLLAPGPVDAVLSAYSWQGLLLEAANIEDETQRRMAGPAGGRVEMVDSSRHAGRPSLPSDDFSSLFDAGAPPQASPPADRLDDDDDTPTPVARLSEKPLSRLLDDATEAFLLHDYPQALRLYERCLALDPGNAQVRLNIDRVRWWLGKG